MREKYPYQEEWEDFRLRYALLFLCVPAFFIFFALVALIKPIFKGWLCTLGYTPIFVFPIVIVAIIISTSAFASLWRCPACNNYFGMTTAIDFLISKPYRAKKCKNCGMPKYYGSTFLAEKFGEERANEISLRWESSGREIL